MLFFDLGRVENNSNGGHLRCISDLVRTGKSDDDADIDRVLLIAALATGDELESSLSAVARAGDVGEEHWVCSSPTSPARATADARSIQAQRW